MAILRLALRHEHVLAFTLAAIEADLDDPLLPWMIDLSSRSDFSHLR